MTNFLEFISTAKEGNVVYRLYIKQSFILNRTWMNNSYSLDLV